MIAGASIDMGDLGAVVWVAAAILVPIGLILLGGILSRWMV